MPRKAKTTSARSAGNTTKARPSTAEEFLQQRQSPDPLRFLTFGSSGDGKSTLIGRLLRESGQPSDDKLAALKTAPEKYGTQGNEIDYARLLDETTAERKQAINVAYRHFATAKRSFLVADLPSDEEYTHNLLSAASTADLAVLLVDAQLGMLEQTCRHAYLSSLMGIRHVVLAVNKMDLVSYDPAAFNRIEAGFRLLAQPLGFASISAIPTSALSGDNLTQRSAHTPWYAGPTLLAYLETVEIAPRTTGKLVFPLQSADRDDASFAGYGGSVAEGRLTIGDEIRVAASGQTAKVAEIRSADGTLEEAVAGDGVTLKLDKNIDASRGDVLGLSLSPLETTDQFEATLVWTTQEPGLIGRSYDIELATQRSSASITDIKYRVNVHTQAHEASKTLELDDISVCNLATGKPLAFDSYQNSRTLGNFCLLDSYSHATVAAGVIRHNLRRAQNVHKQPLSIARADRERLNRHQGKVIWFTGLPGSGKSTLADALEVRLHALGRRTYLLDGDNVRQGLNKDLGFTDADRVENIRRIAEVAKLMMDAGLIVMTAFISPFRRERDMARELIGAEHFVEVYVSTPLAVCEQRDPKGLYKKARSGQLPNMTGVGSAYEVPEQADVTLDCSDAPLATGVQELIDALKI